MLGEPSARASDEAVSFTNTTPGRIIGPEAAAGGGKRSARLTTQAQNSRGNRESGFNVFLISIRIDMDGFFCVTMPRFLPGAAKCLIFFLCGFSALRAEKPHNWEGEYGELRKFSIYCSDSTRAR